MISGVSLPSDLSLTAWAAQQARPADQSSLLPKQASAAERQQQAEQAREIDQLAATDRKVRAHEAAHLAAAGGLATSGASYSMTRGPDGKLYATGGEVSISTSPGRSPEETAARARQIRAAALAPADPSPQDYRVAAQAARMEAEAQRELARVATQENANTQGDAILPATTLFALAAYRTQPRSGTLIDASA